ncbi:MAG: SAM-dependent methyltransferase [Cyanobacteria bacterium QH_9_48_43]|jgi:predicted O-methyltransferase YrrM|nr:MAG: SAM-dependent methyltransferase [Cyanobacteria bacterium QH_10_48_56]PSO60217.1 MAG: SAM-dependent methyltransferase [Cyanobacteria bacterium QH_7_48_89]PSO87983.1 MAG: SAM-dependent methyltransferase [Cyanobacteria bacterium QH_9_48_43]PSP01438.1 MAG: SAM-dependent methyltransferase [Cyanobacteria bacterium SW_12_48_29]PSP05369.1 MAG: SAM-dependent methyltransferase [Cyanobacteria bacterium SW_7_48_12]PSP11715.1 MAG: SAM-dependent methyltransferase [Cyanobacteria bacterium SW_10_48_33
MSTTTSSNLNLKTAPGHEVLAKAGKTVLRPGGLEATRQLLDWADFQPGETVLELAASFGKSAIGLARRYGVRVVGIERNPDSVRIARENIRQAGLEGQVEVREGNILNLADISETFDYVFAEAILTMQSASGKAKILEGIQKVLKPQGKFLSHEMLGLGDGKMRDHALSEVIRVNAQPLSSAEWQQACEKAGLTIKQSKTGEVGLLTPKRVIEDEGLLPALKIAWNVLTQAEIRQRVLRMKDTFTQYQYQLGYIALCASKEE